MDGNEHVELLVGEIVEYGDEILINKPNRDWEVAYFQGFDRYEIAKETQHRFRRKVKTMKQMILNL